MGRTALEIKSTLGALPVPLSTFVHIQLPLAMPFPAVDDPKGPPHPSNLAAHGSPNGASAGKRQGYRIN